MSIATVAKFLRTDRDLVFAIVRELQNRANILQSSAQVAVLTFTNALITSAFGLVGTLVTGGFSLLNAGLIVVLGVPNRPINSADYDAGFEDGRLGMVPAKPGK